MSPPPAGAAGRPRPPRLFTFAMVLCMALGVGGTVDGCSDLQFYRGAERTETYPFGDDVDREQWQRAVRATWAVYDQARATQVPLAAADLVLSSLLLIVAWRTLQGRSGSRGLAAQAVAANAAFAAIEYALSRPMREAAVNAMVEHVPRGLSPTAVPEVQTAEALHQLIYLVMFRVPFGFKLMAYALALVALALPSVRAYLDDVEAGGNAEA